MTPNGEFHYLCQAWGETDLPCVAIVTERQQVSNFLRDQWVGDGTDPLLGELLKEFDEHDWDDDATLSWPFEIGGCTIERVFDVGPPIDMVLFCPSCGEQHLDRIDCVHDHFDAPTSETPPEERAPLLAAMKEWERTHTWMNPPHRSHLCVRCKHVWRPADVATNGVLIVKTRGKEDTRPYARPLEERAVWNRALDVCRDIVHRMTWGPVRDRVVQDGEKIKAMIEQVRK